MRKPTVRSQSGSGVNQRNARANSFYERRGFRLVGERSFQVGDSLEEDFVREMVL